MISQSIVDSCFESVEPSVEFDSNDSLISNIYSGDLMAWNGQEWLGSFSLAEVLIPPPSGKVGCRAIFLGDGQRWTTNGEVVGFKLDAPIQTGETYSFRFTTVSHGLFSDGEFSPRVYTNAKPIAYDTVYVGNIEPSGYSWENKLFSFTAGENQEGHEWLLLSSGHYGSTGMISSNCPECVLCEESVDLGANGSYCSGESILLNAEMDDAVAYSWQDKSAKSHFEASETGSYSVEVLMENCISMDTVFYYFIETPQVDFGINQSLCPPNSFQLDATTEVAEYFWQDGSTDSTFLVSEPGTYWVEVSNICGVDSDTIMFECEEVSVPNIFSPNSDGLNDVFLPYTTEGVGIYSFSIFNRWGSEVFIDSGLSVAWDGKNNGENCPEGVYFWVLSFTDINDKTRTLKGDVNLKR